jgi:hypothetical protein
MESLVLPRIALCWRYLTEDSIGLAVWTITAIGGWASPFTLASNLFSLTDECLQIVVSALFDIFLNPNAIYPGPILCKITYLKFYYEYWKLNQTQWLVELHRQYGKGPFSL